jgi:hypothetical protein
MFYRYAHVKEVSLEPKIMAASHYQNLYILDRYLYIASKNLIKEDYLKQKRELLEGETS